MYMPPEALKSSRYSFSSDIWSICIILYEMLKGFTPWRARSEEVLVSKLLNEPIGGLLEGIPYECREFLMKGLNKEVSERYKPEEIEGIIAEFRRIVADERKTARNSHLENIPVPTIQAQQAVFIKNSALDVAHQQQIVAIPRSPLSNPLR